MPVGDLAPEDRTVSHHWLLKGSLGDMVGGMDFVTELSKITPEKCVMTKKWL